MLKYIRRKTIAAAYTALVIGLLYVLGLFVIIAMDFTAQAEGNVDEQTLTVQQIEKEAEERKIPKIDRVYPANDFTGRIEWSTAHDSGSVIYWTEGSSIQEIERVHLEAPQHEDGHILHQHYDLFEEAAWEELTE